MKNFLFPLIFTLSIIFSNDAPIWLEIPSQSIDEDYVGYQIDLESFVEDPDGDPIIILDPILTSGEIEVLDIDSFILSIIPEENFNNQIILQLTADDGELTSSTEFVLTVNSINDSPFFNNIGNIEINEDEPYNDIWATNISTGANNEDQDLFFTVTFDNPDLIESYSLDSEGFFSITPNLDTNGETAFQVYLSDDEDGESPVVEHTLTINPINDSPFFDNIGNIEINEDEPYNDTWATNISTGADNEDQDLFFTVTFDNPDFIESYTLTPNGQFTIVPTLNISGSTLFSVQLFDSAFDSSDIYTYSLTINSINDSPFINDQSFIIYDEDCGHEICDDTNKLILDITMFDVEDIEDSDELLTLFIDHDNINNNYTTDGEYGIFFNQDYNSENEGVIEVPVYITDSEGLQSQIFYCDVVVNPINDMPYFSNLDTIIINEDNNYYENWAFNISAGAYNENQILEFEIFFENQNLIESYNLNSEGYFNINPNLNANGQSDFSILLKDELSGQSDTVRSQIIINPVNDQPTFDYSPLSYVVDEDTGQHIINWASNLNPGGGTGEFKENDQELNFVIENTYDQSLFSINPELQINNLNEGILTFKLDTNMNGSTNFLITLQDNGDNNLNDVDDSNNGNNISIAIDFPLQINQINDIPESFNIFTDLRNYQLDESTFFTFDNEDIFYRYPYQPVYIENSLPDHLRFEWEWIDSLDIDIYPEINKDILMENIYFRLEAVEVLNSNNIVILADSIIHNISNPDINYFVDIDNKIARIDVDLESISGLDLTGFTEYHWRVVAQNYQYDYQNSDPQIFVEDEDYSFFIDITLPNVNMIPLYDDIFSEKFDLYMLSTERLIDFDNNNRPIKLWIDYGINGIDDQILFPNEIDSLNYIYFLPYSFIRSGDTRLRFQMRDHVENINSDIEDISFGIINPITNSTIGFMNNYIKLDLPKNSTNKTINCLVTQHKQEIGNNNMNLVGDLINIYPDNIMLNNKIGLSFNLSMIDPLYDYSKLGIYRLNNNEFEYCNTYIEDGFSKTMIDNFGTYGLFFNENLLIEEFFPENFILYPSYPNPFNPATSIDFYLPLENDIEISIYNIKGEKVRVLFSGYINSGYHNFIWDGKSDLNNNLPSGIYFINFYYDNKIASNKVIKIK